MAFEFKYKSGVVVNAFHIIETEDKQLLDMLLGVKKLKQKNTFRIEDNLVNRIILGLQRLDNNMCDELECVLPPHLYEYQIKDVNKMAGLKASLNANTMGLGKTIETATLLNSIRPPILIIAPKTVVPHWQKQLETHFNISSEIFPKVFDETGIYITNYEQINNDSIFTSARSFRWNAVVLDEAHKIKNRKSKMSTRIAKLPSARRYALTGTPILNKPDDLWHILNWLNWRYAGKSYWNFVEYFCNVEEDFFGKQIKGLTEDPERQALLSLIIELIGVRNPEIPIAQGKVTIPITLHMANKQRKLYDNVAQLMYDELPEGTIIANGMVLLTRLMQVTSNPLVVDEKCKQNIKFEWIKEFLANDKSRKTVIFTKFAQTAKALKACLDSNACMFIGETPHHDRVAELETFMSGGAQVLIGTIGAMGQGLDGLQEVSNCAVFLERDWSPALQQQAESRLYRHGQKDVVEIYYLNCEHSVDNYVGQINYRKTEDIRRVLNDDKEN